MRLHYYRFPADSDPEVRVKEGCAVVLKSGSRLWPETIPEDKWPLIDHVEDTVDGVSITHAKQLLRKYGGSAWTEHCERDGGVFEVTEITLQGNNSRFRYNRHL